MEEEKERRVITGEDKETNRQKERSGKASRQS